MPARLVAFSLDGGCLHEYKRKSADEEPKTHDIRVRSSCAPGSGAVQEPARASARAGRVRPAAGASGELPDVLADAFVDQDPDFDAPVLLPACESGIIGYGLLGAESEGCYQSS